MAYFIPLPSSLVSATFTFPHRSQVVANFYAHTSPETHPFPLPAELRSSITEEEWQTRTVAIWKHFARFTWSKFMRVYLVVSLILSLIGPISANFIVHRLIYNGLGPLSENSSDEEIRQRIALIKAGQLTNFIAILLIFLFLWAPYLGYKLMGRRRLATLLNSFSRADADKGNMQALNWTCSRTSTFQANATVVIELPIAYLSSNQPTLFHQSAYLPEYIRKEPTSQATSFHGNGTAQNDQTVEKDLKADYGQAERKA